MKFSHKAGISLILLFAVGSVVADSMFKMLSMLYDAFFAVLIVWVALNMRSREKKD